MKTLLLTLFDTLLYGCPSVCLVMFRGEREGWKEGKGDEIREGKRKKGEEG